MRPGSGQNETATEARLHCIPSAPRTVDIVQEATNPTTECLVSSVPAPYVAGVSQGSTLCLASAHQAATSRVPTTVGPGRLRPRKRGDPLAQQQVCFLVATFDTQY